MLPAEPTVQWSVHLQPSALSIFLLLSFFLLLFSLCHVHAEDGSYANSQCVQTVENERSTPDAGNLAYLDAC